jgi:hypothetical protein
MTVLRSRRGLLPKPPICIPPPEPPLAQDRPLLITRVRPTVNPKTTLDTISIELQCHRLDWSGSPVVALTSASTGPGFSVPPTMIDAQTAYGIVGMWPTPGHYLLTVTFLYADSVSESASALLTVVLP